MNSRQDDLRRDLDAALQTRKELGAEYESELVDSFLSRLDARLDAQVDARVERRIAERLDGDRDDGPGLPHGHGFGHGYYRRPQRGGASRRGWMHVFTLTAAIPLSGVAAGTSGLMGLLVCWAGIVGVSFSTALADRRQEQRPAARPRSDWD